MKTVYQQDSFKLDAERITEETHPVFGDMTVFHGVVIASEIVQQYDDGLAFKPREELKKYAPYVDGRWVILGAHPSDGIISERDQVSGRTVNPRYVKDLIDPDSKRPNRAGVRADIQIFNDMASKKQLDDMKNGLKADVSIGFFFSKDESPGTVESDSCKGQAYDYIQRDMFHDHTAACIDNGRCPSPYCGLGADAIGQRITGDPFAGHEDFKSCVSTIMSENPDMNEEDASKICGSLKTKHEDSKLEEESLRNDFKTLIRELLEELQEVKAMKDAKLNQEPEWYLSINWSEDPYPTIFDSLNDETRQLLTEKKLCPKCGKDEDDEKCPEGEEKNEEGECVPMEKEEEGDVLESNPGFAYPAPAAEKECPEGHEWNEEQGKCVTIEGFSKTDAVKELDAYEVLKKVDKLLL